MGVGPGGLSTGATQAAAELFEQGVITVASLRPFFGAVVPGPNPRDMYANPLSHSSVSLRTNDLSQYQFWVSSRRTSKNSTPASYGIRLRHLWYTKAI